MDRVRPSIQRSTAALEAQIQELQRANQELQNALHAAYSGSITMQGYLLKHRPVTQFMGLFAQEWEMRYFVLTGTVLRYYRSERDAAFNPRNAVDVQGCVIEPEEVTNQRQWRWKVVEPGGNTLLRLGTDNKAAAERWLTCLESVGLRVVYSRADAPSSSGTAAQHDGTSSTTGRDNASEADGRLQERWEASSSDSELPEPLTKASSQQQQQRRSLQQQMHLKQQQQMQRQASAQQASAAAAAAMAAGVAAATTSAAIHSGSGGFTLLPSQQASAAAATKGQQSKFNGGSSDGPIAPAPAAAAAASGMQRQRSGKLAAGAAAAGGGVAAAGGGGAVGSSSAAAASRPPMSGSTPVHTTVRYSYLSSDGIWMAKHDGLLNLGIIILITTNFRLILENLLKYGWRLNFISYISRSLAGRGNLPLVLAFPALVLLSLLSLAAELLGLYCLKVEEQYKAALSKKVDDEKLRQKLFTSRVRQTDILMLLLHTFCSGAALLLPCIVIHLTNADAVPGIILMLWTLTVVMKLISYAHCHADLRTAHRRNDLRPGERGAPGASADWAVLRYPENLTISNMLYYLAVPTLTYQVNFPRTPRVRKRWLMRRVFELACFTGLLLFISAQYLEPAVSNAIMPLSQSDWVRVVERVLKLALPNLYAWLCMFYCLFHLYLNILGELTRFGDREFYKDFWNAATIGDYWKLWNMPVHKWLLRTIYFPAMNYGINRWWAMILVFFVSAIGHEVVVGVPLHMMRGWAFLGIMLQVPLISITEKIRQRLKSDTWGNFAFWFTFCIIGQPVSILMYVHDYMFQTGGYKQIISGSSDLMGQAAAGHASDYLREA